MNLLLKFRHSRLQLGVILFIPIITAIPFQCIYDKTEWVGLGLQYQCKVGNISVESPEVSIDAVNGTHLPGKSNDDVKVIALYLSPNMIFLPKDLEKFFPNIEGIVVAFSGLSEITENDLKPFQYLKVLHLLNNRIKVFDAKNFKFNPDLKHIFIQNDTLQSISANIIDPGTEISEGKSRENICNKVYGLDQKSEEVLLQIKEKCESFVVQE